MDSADLDKLNDKDKAELRQFITNEQQRTRLQAQTHTLTDTCWKKCVTGPIKSGSLDKTEQVCMASCVERFMDLNLLTTQLLTNKMRK
ncbi:mitochondrial import inner membrane translocase subunit TIM8 [Lasiosphaeria ovina]|uniref:Mitochondrial import inner membrane translocase subunit n=1 Tax=Lasiosphaeria ovina TaxID=92902 RepID=A0AAE0TS78_9PEZI|nr:mitochondrial import inner membrane translocase subunit TIM8 [Lasiosphaeria ovina]